eukprot:scaffold1677_cov122-Cylindrotheca_fusiformis.AAC.2
MDTGRDIVKITRRSSRESDQKRTSWKEAHQKPDSLMSRGRNHERTRWSRIANLYPSAIFQYRNQWRTPDRQDDCGGGSELKKKWMQVGLTEKSKRKSCREQIWKRTAWNEPHLKRVALPDEQEEQAEMPLN